MQKYIAGRGRRTEQGRMEEESDQLYQRPKVMGKTWDIEKKNKENCPQEIWVC